MVNQSDRRNVPFLINIELTTKTRQFHVLCNQIVRFIKTVVNRLGMSFIFLTFLSSPHDDKTIRATYECLECMNDIFDTIITLRMF